VTTLDRLKAKHENNDIAQIAIVGAGYVGTGVIQVLAGLPSVTPALVVNRDVSKGVKAFAGLGIAEEDVVVSSDVDTLRKAISNATPAVTDNYELILDLPINIVVEATGAIDYGTKVMLDVLAAGKDVISFNAEADCLFAFELHRQAKRNGAIYTIADGDQPGAQLRMKEQAELMGFEVTAMINCKRHLNVYQNPETGAGYSARDTTSAHMTTSFGDGTKMQIEQAVVANIASYVPAKRGMIGIESTVENAAIDISSALPEGKFVEFTLAGDFAAGVGVMCRHERYDLHEKAMRFYKMGDGPDYFFFRPFHLVHLELAQTISNVCLNREPLGAVESPHATEVVAMAKKDLTSGEKLDCIGGFSAYGHIDSSAGAEGHLPMCLIEYASVNGDVAQDQPVPLKQVELDTSVGAVKLWLNLQKEWDRNAEFREQINFV